MKDSSHTIRPAEGRDALALSILGTETFTQAYREAISFDDLKTYTKQAFDPDLIQQEIETGQAYYAVADIKGILCGYAQVKSTPAPSEITAAPSIELRRLYVASGWMGQSMGTALLNHMLVWVQTHNYASLWLRVWEKNPRTIALYERSDFEITGSEPYHVGTMSETVLIMTKAMPL